MAASRAPRSRGGASGARLRNTPEKAGPNPSPAIRLPAYSPAAEPRATASNVIPTPATRTSEPPITTARGGRERAAAAASTPAPASAAITAPRARRLSPPSRLVAREGPSERYSPPSAQVATSDGTEAAKSAGAGGGTPISGRIELSQPGAG